MIFKCPTCYKEINAFKPKSRKFHDIIRYNPFCSVKCSRSFVYDQRNISNYFIDFHNNWVNIITKEDVKNIVKDLNCATVKNNPVLMFLIEKHFSHLSKIKDNLEKVIVLKDFNGERPTCRINGCKNYVNRKNKIFHKFCSTTCSAKSDETLLKRKETNLSKFGVENPFQSNEIKEKIKNTNLLKYGAENAAQSKIIQEKMKNTCLNRYGYSNWMKSLEDNTKNLELISNKRKAATYKSFSRFNNKIIPLFGEEYYVDTRVNEKQGKSKLYLDWKCVRCDQNFKYKYYDARIPKCPNCDVSDESSPEQFIRHILDSNNIKYVQNDRSLINPLELDFYIPDKNIAIEVNGIFWHSELQGKDKNYHLDKTRLCKSKKIDLIHIFENEIEFKPKLVEKRILSKLGILNGKRIYARKCIIKEIKPNVKSKFMKEYHIQGNDHCSIKLGLFYEDILISVMTFSKLRKALGSSHKEGHFELSRFCTDYNYIVCGAGSKLLKYFIRNYNPKNIISYCDLRWNNGNSYYKMGFNFVHTTSPNYWYVHSSNYLDLKYRYGFRKNVLKEKLELFNSDLSEWENMKANGYDRIWDCGNIKFEMTLK